MNAWTWVGAYRPRGLAHRTLHNIYSLALYRLDFLVTFISRVASRLAPGCYNDGIALKYDSWQASRQFLDSAAAEVPVNIQSDWQNLHLSLVA